VLIIWYTLNNSSCLTKTQRVFEQHLCWPRRGEAQIWAESRGNGAKPQELTQVSDWGESRKPTPKQLEV
ncbi:hypothetical protein JV45_05490, partial [Serratia sp. Ag2]